MFLHFSDIIAIMIKKAKRIKHISKGTGHINPGIPNLHVKKTNKEKTMNFMGVDWGGFAQKGKRNFKLGQITGQLLMLYYGLSTGATKTATTAFLVILRQTGWLVAEDMERVKRTLLKNKDSRRVTETVITGIAVVSSVPHLLDENEALCGNLAAATAITSYLIMAIDPWIQKRQKNKARRITRKIFNEQRKISHQLDNIKNSKSVPVGFMNDIEKSAEKIAELNAKSERYEKRINALYSANLLAGSLLVARGGLQLLAGVTKMMQGQNGWPSIVAGAIFITGSGMMFLNKLGERRERSNHYKERMEYQKTDILRPAQQTIDALIPPPLVPQVK